MLDPVKLTKLDKSIYPEAEEVHDESGLIRTS